MTHVRRAHAGDADVVAGTFASAFAEDPVFRFMSGVEDTEARVRPFWRAMASTNLRKPDHEVYLTADGSSAAVWQGIDKWRMPVRALLRSTPAMLSSFRGQLLRGVALMTAMEKVHPKEPHYYLEFLGTRRDGQGRGGGSTVLGHFLERCDAEGVPAYLESSNPRNIPFYARHGFVERTVVKGPKGAPVITPMWREPRG